MLSMVLLLAVAAGGSGTCADHRVADAVELELLIAAEEEAYADAEYDFEARLSELGLVGSTLARDAKAAGASLDTVAEIALGPSFDVTSTR